MTDIFALKKKNNKVLPGGPVVKDLPPNVGDEGLIPGRETKISHAALCGQKKLRYTFNKLLTSRLTVNLDSGECFKDWAVMGYNQIRSGYQ